MIHAETMIVSTPITPCEGEGGSLGHPLVYLHLKNGKVECPYCGRLFMSKEKI